MITEWLLSLGVILSDWFASLFPSDFEVPAFFTELTAFMDDLFTNAAGLGAWIDFTFIITTVSVVLAVWAIAFGVKIARAVAAHLPLVGGAG